MKKSVVITAFIVGILSAVVLVTGWPSLLETQKRDENIYVQSMNEALVSFTDCADQFSDSLEKMASGKSAPSDWQITEMENYLDRLEKVCRTIESLNAPGKYAQAQLAINHSMNEYRAAFEKCRALLDFYKSYDERFHRFKDPIKGSAKMEKTERALYNEFARAMLKATDSFRVASECFGNQ